MDFKKGDLPGTTLYTVAALVELLSGNYDSYRNELEMVLRNAARAIYTRNKSGSIVAREREKLVVLARHTVVLLAEEMEYDGYQIRDRIKELEFY